MTKERIEKELLKVREQPEEIDIVTSFVNFCNHFQTGIVSSTQYM